VRLLLDEMISPRIARELREAGHDVQAIKKDRADLVGRTDRELIQRMSGEGRAIVTNDVADFQVIHERMLAAGEDHAGIVFTFDATMPRRKATIDQWMSALTDLLGDHGEDDALPNRVHHLL
jgi:predicted nuclease of predicted toxin-antitoxin system